MSSQQRGAALQEPGGDWTDEKHSQVRRITAQRLLESKQTVPHYYVTIATRVRPGCSHYLQT